jgi:hypothetical protein
MAIPLKQSTASQEILLGPFLDETDGITAMTALTIANTDIKIWKTGGTTEANKNSGGATHIAGGRYYAVLDATDTDTLGALEINVHATGALPVRRECVVLPANAYDSSIAGTDTFQADVTQWNGTAVTTPATAGSPVVTLADAAITTAKFAAGAINAAAIADGAIDAATFAANAIAAATLAADVTTELQNGLATAAALTTVEGKIDTLDTVADGIKAKTDSLTFTVAGEIDANAQSINGVAITGDGAGTPWNAA